MRKTLFLLLSLVIGGAAAQDKPALKGVSGVRVANYGAPSKLLESRADVNAVLEELAKLRAKPWPRREAKLTCYASVILLNGKKELTTFRIKPDTIVERVPEKGGQATYYSLAIAEADIPLISKLLQDAPPAKCK
ncbi:MAG TPA: hypothetical protein VFK84_02370 [Burkholderiales bacterium]|nr:hypothetical protein [Burkholderiales bacterium]